MDSGNNISAKASLEWSGYWEDCFDIEIIFPFVIAHTEKEGNRMTDIG